VSRRLLAPVAMMGAIFFLSAQPFDGDELAWWEVVGRNLGHFLGYAMLAAAWVWALAGKVRWTGALALAGALSLAYAVSDEYHQTFVEGRSGVWEDVVIDALGIATTLIMVNTRAAKTESGKDAGPRTPPGEGLQRP
jgi:hypothetical protein